MRGEVTARPTSDFWMRAPYNTIPSSCFDYLQQESVFDQQPKTDRPTSIMAQSTTPAAKASTSIPYILRFPLLWLEPFFALNGAILTLVKPEMYTSTMTRGALQTLHPASQFIYTELAGGWLHFAFTEGVVLRLVDDVRVWKLLCVGMLLSDMAYCHSCAEAVGGWAEYSVVSRWTMEDWVVTITTWPFVLARIAIVLGIGEKSAQKGGKKSS